MIYNFCLYNKNVRYSEYTEDVFHAIKNKIHSISVSLDYASELINLIDISTIDLSVCIDYPFGNETLKNKKHLITNAYRKGIKTIDIVINENMIANNSKLISDLVEISKISQSFDSNFSIIPNIEVDKHKDYVDLCYEIQSLNIKHVYTSTGLSVDDYIDGIILCEMIQQNTILTPILSSQLWNAEQFETIKLSNIYGVRLYNKYNFVYI